MATETNNAHKYLVGDILYTSWGYEQTNVAFWQVIKTTDKTVWLRPIAKKTVEVQTSMSGTVEPVPNIFTDYALANTKDSIIRRRVKAYDDRQPIFGSNSWDTFYPYGGEPVYESSYY
ncbi:hypothetical protein GQR36_24640 [Enterococcus termitis]|uniref:Uncharacterized protein n=2 Tax=Enterococcus termitis TaxID=332950 RepID=A0A1E5GJT6_9ENTE|nr:hypothetical protein BCR25_05540 [Enterococcus termitis]